MLYPIRIIDFVNHPIDHEGIAGQRAIPHGQHNGEKKSPLPKGRREAG